MNVRTLALRAPVLLALAFILAWLAAQSSLLRLLQVDAAPGAWGVYVFLGACLALTPALFASGSPLPATLAVTVPVILAASYGASRLEWLKTLKEFDLVEGPVFAVARLVLAALALALAWGLHAADAGIRLGGDALARGIARPEATAARQVVWVRSARVGGLALAAAVGVGAAAIVSALVLPTILPAEGVSFIAPLAAATLVGVAALLVLGVRKKGAPATADDAE